LGSIVRFSLFVAALLALLVFVVVPVVAGAVVTSAVRDAGFVSDDLDVSVDLLGAELLEGRAPAIRLRADGVRIPRAVIGRLDVVVRGVSLDGRSFRSVDGVLTDVEVTGPSGIPIAVARVDLSGPAERTLARATVSEAETRALVQRVARQASVPVEEVRLGDDRLTIRSGGEERDVRLRVAGGALIMEADGLEPTILVSPPPSEAWDLEGVGVSSDGITIDLALDARRLLQQLDG
jgi:hypothetical protein